MKDKKAIKPRKVNSLTLEEVDKALLSLGKHRNSIHYMELVKRKAMLLGLKSPK